jgi:hypothetical protein
MLQNLKIFEFQHDATSWKFHAMKLFHVSSFKLVYKITFRLCVQGTYEHKLILCFDLGPIHNISYYIYVIIPC